MPDGTIGRDEVLAATEQLLQWPEIVRSPQLGRFLRYIVDNTLDGNVQSIKAYAIAVDVFGRPPDFDPQADPIVRVQARRLRALLEQYYAGPGQDSTIRIDLPVGRYVPQFSRQAVAASDAISVADRPSDARRGRISSRPGSLPWVALSVLALGLVLSVFALWTIGQGQPRIAGEGGALAPPSITVAEFQNLAGEGALAPISAGLAIELVTDLDLFEDMDVRYGGSIAAVPPPLPDTDFLLTGVVRPDGAVVQYSAVLTDRASGAVVWNHTIALSAEQSRNPDMLDSLSRALSLLLGSSRGPLHEAARSYVDGQTAGFEGANGYLCRIAFDSYRDTGGAADASRTLACLDNLSQASAGTAAALAIRASLNLDGFGADKLNEEERYVQAGQLLEQALALSPISAFVWEQQGWLEQARGQLASARSAFSSSLQLNPASADAVAAYARLLALTGDIEESERLSNEAVNGSPNPPAWYFAVPALVALRSGEAARAVETAELYARSDWELGPVLAIMAGQQAGDSAVVSRFLTQVLDVASFRQAGVMPQLRRRIEDPVLLADIEKALLEAGLPAQNLNAAF